MTRTERSISPRAIIKDRSEARNGLDPRLRKGGAGAHNWGTFGDEARYEYEALDDELHDLDAARADGETVVPAEARGTSPRPIIANALSEEERVEALRVRQQAFKKGGVDLSEIARSSSAVSGSPPSN